MDARDVGPYQRLRRRFARGHRGLKLGDALFRDVERRTLAIGRSHCTLSWKPARAESGSKANETPAAHGQSLAAMRVGETHSAVGSKTEQVRSEPTSNAVALPIGVVVVGATSTRSKSAPGLTE